MSFHARLASRGRVYIPKRIVEEAMLWVGSRIRVSARSIYSQWPVEFKARVRSGFCFTIPSPELESTGAKHQGLLEIHVAKLEPPLAEAEVEKTPRKERKAAMERGIIYLRSA